jgi:8-oxo-dGTP diphosphatase
MPETTAAALLTRPGHPDQVLLTRRNVPPFRGLWCIPGGHIDPFEPAREAVEREAREETGLEFDAQFLGYFDEILPDYGIHAVVLAFYGEGQGEPILQQAEVQEIRWFTLEEALELSLAFDHKTILAAFSDQQSALGDQRTAPRVHPSGWLIAVC